MTEAMETKVDPIHPSVAVKASPNFSSREGKPIEAVVIHYTAGGSAEGSISWLTNPESKASAHFVIGRDGATTQLVALHRSAWHAGASEAVINGKAVRGLNRYSIGIELCNHGLLHKDNQGKFWYELAGNMKPYKQAGVPVFSKILYSSGYALDGWWEPYPEAQIKSLHELLTMLKDLGYAKAVSNLLGHEEICVPVGRKSDPGPMFPWAQFSRKSSAIKSYSNQGGLV